MRFGGHAGGVGIEWVRIKGRRQCALELACNGGEGLGGRGSLVAAVCSLVSLAVRYTAGGVLRASGDGSGTWASEDCEFDRVCTCVSTEQSPGHELIRCCEGHT